MARHLPVWGGVLEPGNSLAQKRRENSGKICVWANFYSLIWIPQKTSQILWAIFARPSVVFHHILDPFCWRHVLKAYLDFPLQINLRIIRYHVVTSRPQWQHQIVYDEPNENFDQS